MGSCHYIADDDALMFENKSSYRTNSTKNETNLYAYYLVGEFDYSKIKIKEGNTCLNHSIQRFIRHVGINLINDSKSVNEISSRTCPLRFCQS